MSGTNTWKVGFEMLVQKEAQLALCKSAVDASPLIELQKALRWRQAIARFSVYTNFPVPTPNSIMKVVKLFVQCFPDSY